MTEQMYAEPENQNSENGVDASGGIEIPASVQSGLEVGQTDTLPGEGEEQSSTQGFQVIKPFVGPDDLSEALAEKGQDREQTEAEARYYADHKDVPKVDVSEEALKGLSPKEQKEKRYANAAAYFHESDRLMQTEGASDRVKELRAKAKQLYEEADNKYEGLYDVPPPGTLDDTLSDQVTLSGNEAEEDNSKAPAPAPAEAVPAATRRGLTPEQQERIDRNNAARKEKTSRAQIDRAAANLAADQARRDKNWRERMQSTGVQPKVEFAQPANSAPQPSFLSRVGRRIGGWLNRK